MNLELVLILSLPHLSCLHLAVVSRVSKYINEEVKFLYSKRNIKNIIFLIDLRDSITKSLKNHANNIF